MKLINLKPKTENRKQKTKGKFKSPPCYILNLLTNQKKKKSTLTYIRTRNVLVKLREKKKKKQQRQREEEDEEDTGKIEKIHFKIK